VPRLLPDLTPWRASRDFRLLWSSGVVTMFGGFLTFVAVPVQMKELTGSTLAVGAIGLVELVPLILFGLYGGALADAFDRRKVIVWTEAGQGLLVALLLVNTLLPHPMVWPLYVIAALSSAQSGLQRPAQDAIVPRIVAHDQLTAAAALTGIRWQIGGVAGPSLAGVLIAYAGLEWAYVIDIVTFVVSVPLVLAMGASPAAHDAEKPSLAALAEGARYAWSRKELLGTFAVDLAATVLAFPIALFPFLADELHAPWALGLMYASFPAGALLVSLTSGWASRVHHHGRAMVAAAMVFGLAVTAAGLARHVWLVLPLLMLAGGIDIVSGIFRTAMWNQTIPDEFRGRLAGIGVLSFTVGPQAGQIRAGGVGALIGVRAAIWTGGLSCVAAVGLLAVSLPKLWSYDARTNEHAVRARAEQATGTAAEPA
jgi:MFS family permease